MSSTHKILIETVENAPDEFINLGFEDFIKEIPSKTPIKAGLQVKSSGEFIKVKGNVSTILILECDRCLSEFEYKLEFEFEEIFAKTALLEEYGQELELKEGQFITDLNNVEEIDIYDLLYQSVIINLPNKKVCGINCKEGLFETEEGLKAEDSRLEVFKRIKLE